MLQRIATSLLLLLIAYSNSSYANEMAQIAKIKDIIGPAKIVRQGSMRPLKINSGQLETLYTGDTLTTYGRATVSIVDGSQVVFDPNTTIQFISENQLAHRAGKALYEVKNREALEGMKVATRLSIIGVKGTQFLVNDTPGSMDVLLTRGVVDLASEAGAFEVYKQKEMDEFAAFKQQIEGDFEQYKQQMNEEFIGYKSVIEMEAGTQFTISGAKAVEKSPSEQLRSDIAKMVKRLLP